MEFSQKYVTIAGIATIVFVGLSYLFGSLGFETLENLSIEIVRWFSGVTALAFAGYNAQNSVRASSYNKYVKQCQTSGEEAESDDSDSNETPVLLSKTKGDKK